MHVCKIFRTTKEKNESPLVGVVSSNSLDFFTPKKSITFSVKSPCWTNAKLMSINCWWLLWLLVVTCCCFFCGYPNTLPETNSSPLEMDAWNYDRFLFGAAKNGLFSGVNSLAGFVSGSKNNHQWIDPWGQVRQING